MNKSPQQSGYVLVSVVVMILFLTALGVTIAGLTSMQYQSVKRSLYEQNAQLTAEAGIEQTVNQLNANDSFSGYSSDYQFFNTAVQGKGTFTTSVTTNADGSSKTITSVGKVYRSGSSAQPTITRKIRVTVVGTSSSGYSVYGGPGGLILSGSATITNSAVYVGGTLTMQGAAKIGTTTNPVTVNIANNACPTGAAPGSSYPTVCTATQPISLAWSTYIYGTVCATGQTSTGPNNNIVGGTTGEGLKIGCTTPVAAQPTYNRQNHINAVTTSAAGSSNTYVCASWPFDRTWPANLKLTGDVAVDGSCNITIYGNTYITGNLTIGGAAKITVANSVGATRPVVLVDGTITVGGSASLIANSSGAGIEFISFKSSASCNPNCTSLSGNDLKTSQALQTVSIGGGVNLPGMIFNAYWGKLTLAGSGNVGAVAGQTIDMSGAGTVIFGTILSSGSKTWAITSYQPTYDP